MKILGAAAEIFPLVKTGGLADVAGALPAALAGYGVETRTILPGYPAVLAALETSDEVHRFPKLFGGHATLRAGKAASLDLLVLDAPHLYDRPGSPYAGPDGREWSDNARRFAALSYAAAEIGRGRVAAFVPDVVHCHDWHAALTAAYLRFSDAPAAPSVITIHNLAFQGIYSAATFLTLDLPDAAWSMEGLEFYGKVSFLKGGLQYADAITTVSPTYAREICTPAGGIGLDGVLRARQNVLHGILNGIDTSFWNPATDPALAATYGPKTLADRAKNKRAVEARAGLAHDDGILFAVISRLTEQKGIDLIAACLDEAVGAGARFAILGTGEPHLEALMRESSLRHGGRVATTIGYSEETSHLLQGGADAVLVPSRFEPCGLTQFYGLRYGCVPVVSRVGGLADSVIDANDAALLAHAATGIQFQPVDRDGLMGGLNRAMALYADRDQWRRLQTNGMKAEVSWRRSAGEYAALYKTVAAAPR